MSPRIDPATETWISATDLGARHIGTYICLWPNAQPTRGGVLDTLGFSLDEQGQVRVAVVLAALTDRRPAPGERLIWSGVIDPDCDVIVQTDTEEGR